MDERWRLKEASAPKPPEPEQKKRTRLTRPVEGQGEFSLCRTLTRRVFVIQVFHISHVFELLFVAVGHI